MAPADERHASFFKALSAQTEATLAKNIRICSFVLTLNTILLHSLAGGQLA